MASPTLVEALGTSHLVQSTCTSVEDIEAAVDPSTTFYQRQRSAGTIYGWNEDGTEQVALAVTNASGGAEGF